MIKINLHHKVSHLASMINSIQVNAADLDLHNLILASISLSVSQILFQSLVPFLIQDCFNPCFIFQFQSYSQPKNPGCILYFVANFPVHQQGLDNPAVNFPMLWLDSVF